MNKISKCIKISAFNIILPVLYISLNSYTLPSDSLKTYKFRLKTVVIDAGHGGKDPGTHGLHSTEKTVALAIAKKLRNAIQDRMGNINVVMTRTDDTFIPLDTRSAIANAHNGNLFISIHCNS